jgi:hypothetical protein
MENTIQLFDLLLVIISLLAGTFAIVKPNGLEILHKEEKKEPTNETIRGEKTTRYFGIALIILAILYLILMLS